MSTPETPRSKHETPIENTLFTEALFEHVAENVSETEAYRTVGLVAPEDIPEVVKTQGAAVALGAHAVAAFENIMQTYSKLNMARGARIQREKKSPQHINTAYDKPDKIINGMDINAASRLAKNDADLNILNDTAGMLAAGFTLQETMKHRDEYKAWLWDTYGPGNAIWKDRREFLKQVGETVKNAQKKKAS